MTAITADPPPPPQDIGAELAVLAAVLADPAALPNVAGILGQKAFYRPVHQHLYDTIASLAAAGSPVGPTSVLSAVRAAGGPLAEGSARLLAELLTPPAGDPDFYAVKVSEAAEHRRSIEIHTRGLQRSYTAASIDDLRACDAATATELLYDTAGVDSGRPLPGIDLAALDRPVPEPDWLVPGRIIRGTLTILGARPGIGKSWIAQDLAVALCTPRPWLGQQIDEPARVLYIDAENGTDLALERLQRLGASSHALGGRLHYTTASITLPSAPAVAQLVATLEAHKPDLVVVDTLASVAPSAERDTEASADFLTAVWHLARDHGAAMLLLHHLRKSLQGTPRGDDLDAFRGAGHLAGAAHRAWLLDPLAPGEPKFILKDVKARRGRKLDGLRIHVEDHGPDLEHTRLEVAG